MANNDFKGSVFFITAVLMTIFTALFAFAQTDVTRPTVIAVSPENNELMVAPDSRVTVIFSEEMNPATIGADSFVIMRRTTPESGAYRAIDVEKTITYGDRTVTLWPNFDFSTGQEYGNVFTVMVTTDAQDLAGNALAQDYVWSFSTGQSAFNTDATTAQLDQTSNVPVTSPAVATTVPSTVATTVPNDVFSRTSPFVWALGALLVLLIVIVFFVFAMKPSENSINEHPFGEIHPIIDIEGIGPEYNKQLQAVGIRNTKQLWQADSVRVSRQTGISQNLIESWQHMAELSSVKDIGPQYAELLERSGVHSISQLKSYDTRTLLKLVRQKQNSLQVKIQSNPVGPALVEHWIDEARGHKFAG